MKPVRKCFLSVSNGDASFDAIASCFAIASKNLVMKFVYLIILTYVVQGRIIKAAEVQWYEAEKLLKMYFCTGQVDWVAKDIHKFDMLAAYEVAANAMCPERYNSTTRILYNVANLRKILEGLTELRSCVGQNCLDGSIKTIIESIFCCPKLKTTLQKMLITLYNATKCGEWKNSSLCRILGYGLQDKLLDQVYHLAITTRICKSCPGHPPNETQQLRKLSRRKRQYDYSSFMRFAMQMIRFFKIHGINIDLDKPLIHLRHLIFIFDELLYCVFYKNPCLT